MGSRKKNKKKIPPSRQRYEQTHPVVSIRLSREISESLEKFKQAHGLSLADILKLGLDKAKLDLEIAHSRGMEDGYLIGYGSAQDEYEVTYWCGHCRGRHLSITTEEEREAAANFMYRAGWHDPDCPRR